MYTKCLFIIRLNVDVKIGTPFTSWNMGQFILACVNCNMMFYQELKIKIY